MELQKKIDEIEKIGFQKFEGNSLFEMNKTMFRFFVNPKNLFVQVYATKDGSNAHARGFIPETFKPVDSKFCDSIEEVDQYVQGF